MNTKAKTSEEYEQSQKDADEFVAIVQSHSGTFREALEHALKQTESAPELTYEPDEQK